MSAGTDNQDDQSNVADATIAAGVVGSSGGFGDVHGGALAAKKAFAEDKALAKSGMAGALAAQREEPGYPSFVSDDFRADHDLAYSLGGGVSPNFGRPSDERSAECRDENLCNLCGESLEADDDVYIFFQSPIPLYPEDRKRPSEHGCDRHWQPLVIHGSLIINGGVLHPRCSSLVLAHCPVMRPAMLGPGVAEHDGPRDVRIPLRMRPQRPNTLWRHYLARVPLKVFLAAKRDWKGRPDDIRGFELVDVEPLRDAHPADRKLETSPGWEQFPKGLPRPLWQGMPVPYNTTSFVEAA